MAPEGWLNVTSHEESLATFVSTTTSFLQYLGLNGVDIAWFYPNKEGMCLLQQTYFKPKKISAPNKKLSCKFVVVIPVRTLLMEGVLLNWAKYLLRWGTGAIMPGCSS